MPCPNPKCGGAMQPIEAFLRAELEGLAHPDAKPQVCLRCGEVAALEVELNETDLAACRAAVDKRRKDLGIVISARKSGTQTVDRRAVEAADFGAAAADLGATQYIRDKLIDEPPAEA